MAVTIKTNARGWREVSSTAYWTGYVLHDTGSALYAVVQDTGATPKIRVMKADSRTAPTTWTEQDSADNKAITNVDYPFSSSYEPATGYIHVIAFSATNTITYYFFNTGSDQWQGSGSTVTTAASNERPIRCTTRSDGDILVIYTSSADDADIVSSRWEGSTWTALDFFATSSTEASTVQDFLMGTSDRVFLAFYDVGSNDSTMRSMTSANSLESSSDVDDTIATAETAHSAGGRFTSFDDSGTLRAYIAYIDSDASLQERTRDLTEGTAAGLYGTKAAIEGTATDVGTRTPISTAVLSGTPYAAWWDDVSSGTIKYSTKSGGAWAAETNFATGITNLIEIVPVSPGLAVVYQSGSDVVMDWIVSPISNVTVNGSLATASASANSGSNVIDVTGSNATASASANSGTIKVGYTVNGSLATASALANSGALAIDLTGALATASANAYIGLLSFAPAASLATATALANAGTPTIDIQGSLATASALANASTVAVDIMGSNATATAEAFFGTQEVGVKINGSLATASAEAFSGTTQEVTGDIEERSGYFQLRPILEVEA